MSLLQTLSPVHGWPSRAPVLAFCRPEFFILTKSGLSVISSTSRVSGVKSQQSLAYLRSPGRVSESSWTGSELLHITFRSADPSEFVLVQGAGSEAASPFYTWRSTCPRAPGRRKRLCQVAASASSSQSRSGRSRRPQLGSRSAPHPLISPSVPPPTPPPCLESRSSGGRPEVSRRHPSESLLLLQHCVGCAGSFSFLHKLRGPWVGGHVLQGGVRIAGVFPVLCENHSAFRWGQTAPGRGTAGLGRVHELRSLSGPVVPEHL